MNKLAIAMLPGLLGLLTGCGTTTPRYDAKFGDAVREARLGMTLNPDAGKNADQAAGMDGAAARETMTLYKESFKAPPPAVNVINIGGPLGSGSGK
jgi:hypothetical protein